MHRLLTRGYHFGDWDDISFVKRVSDAEVGWALGYMIRDDGTHQIVNRTLSHTE
jgi:hypothetical protein